jgi:hypothetical protein
MGERPRGGPALDALCIGAALAVALGVFWAAERRIAGTAGLSSFPLDDSWIHLHFARNLAEGHGFAYNPGSPVGGSTAPLWTLLLGALFAVLGSHPAWVKLLGIAAALATALVTRRLVWQWTGRRSLALCGGVVTAVAGPMVWGALSGMEVPLAALLVTGAISLHAAGRDGAAAVMLGLATVARPECLLLVPLVALAGPIAIRRAAVFAAAVAVPLAPWVLFNLATAGTPLPATAAAKIEGGLIGFLSGTRESLAEAVLARPWRFEVGWVRWLFSVDVALPALALIGVWALWRDRGRAAGLPAAVLIVHPLGMALLAPYRDPGFQEGRYSIHLLPLAIAVALAGVDLVSRSRRARALARARQAGVDGEARAMRAPRDRGWRRVVGRALAAALLAGALWTVPGAASRYGWAVENIDAMQVQMGQWVAAHTPTEARIALNDIGAIAYVSRREVVDVMGLVTPAIVPYRQRGEAGVLAYLERACPDYLVIFPAWFPELAAMADLFTPIHRIGLANNTVAGADEMVVYETPWHRWKGARRPCHAESRP